MPVRVALTHRTRYSYDRPVSLSPHEIRLRPAPHCRTPIGAYALVIEPAQHFINWQQDPYGNWLARVVFPERTASLEVVVDLTAELTVINPFDFFVEPYAETFPFAYSPTLRKELTPFLEPPPAGPLLDAWLERFRQSVPPGISAVNLLVDVNRRLEDDIAYLVRMEPGVQSAEETLAQRSGSCRDSAWLLVQVLRRLGIAARFASGYLIQLAADIKSLDGPTGVARDFTDLHAWAEAYVPGAGWVGLDPTSGLLAGEGHIPLACTASPGSAAPITGLADVADVRFDFAMSVARVHEDPRVTRPYSEEQWQAIDALGERVDIDLAAGDVRLTQGGEPTFVAIDDVDAPEWNITAMAPAKRNIAETLVRRLKDRFAPGGLLHVGQGKWYPGEPLPRWALGVYWRADGEPLWRDAALLADAREPGRATNDTAHRFIDALAQALGLPEGHVLIAWESTAATPDRTADAAANIAGFVLPLKAVHETEGADTAWQTAAWPLTSERLHAVAGDSPLGLRLPLAQLPEKLPVRTALTVEVRDGHTCVFVPPVVRVVDYACLIAAIEDIARGHGTPVVVEGYPPPREAAIRALLVTPDPGVIEVNVHPASSWRDLLGTTRTLYEEARLARLTTEKFMLDGRHTGTGGGNHITLGGATAAKSPLLRRPDLLQSLIVFWQNHPALSYLFSGTFVGPTSQAPRVDEARDDRLYELAIAFQQLDRIQHSGEVAAKPALVDRLLRHLLTDLTGNTHRAEFSIDKLYSPDTPAGRLGLLEFRAFEMPPHERMAGVQMLLLRALVARFWRAPYRGALVYWGTALHDRWLLPQFVMADLRDVVADLAGHGYAFAREWFDPFAEFRFPRFGGVTYDGVTLELRQAIEPWHVLGEEIGRTGTARYVDSSVERLQAKVTGMVATRHAVTCNGRALPLTPTGIPGEFVAGVRFKAWSPPSALHPTIGVQAPLRFDVVDRWAQRALGGCTYHVVHPGGRNYDAFPVNANEAESRRLARFWPHGHTPGPVIVHDEPPNPATPTTLDLRWNP
jgi:uncharacterized protein (DUF2126 family)/transglutaminase-like putative cysteine protease